MTERHLLLASASAVPGHEEAFERWCVAEHLPHMLTAPGITAAQSFRATCHSTTRGRSTTACRPFLNIYEIEGPVASTQDGLARLEGPWRQLSPAMVQPSVIRYYRSLYREGAAQAVDGDDRLLLLRGNTAEAPRIVGLRPARTALRGAEIGALALTQRHGTTLEPGEGRFVVLGHTHEGAVAQAVQGLLEMFPAIRPAPPPTSYRPTGPRQVAPA